jgi:hypothetical protein
MKPFDYAVFNYGYGYTDNAGTHAAAHAMAVALGAVEPIEHRCREAPMLERAAPTLGASASEGGE